jgi:hypothetical protein
MGDVLLTVAVCIVQLMLGVMGIYVALKPPNKERHAFWIAGFVVVGLLGIVLTGALAWHSSNAQRDVSNKLSQSVIEQARMSGELTAIKEIMGRFATTGMPGFKEFASAIESLSQSNARRAADLTVSNKQLCDRASDLAKRIRDFQNKFEAVRREALYTPLPVKAEERRAVWDKQIQEDRRQYEEHDVQFRNEFFGDAKYLKDLMLAKLPVDKHDVLVKNNGQAEANLSTGMMVGAFNEYGIANYLDEIAKTLCPPKH